MQGSDFRSKSQIFVSGDDPSPPMKKSNNLTLISKGGA